MKRSHAVEMVGLLKIYCQMNNVEMEYRLSNEESNVAYITLKFEPE